MFRFQMQAQRIRASNFGAKVRILYAARVNFHRLVPGAFSHPRFTADVGCQAYLAFPNRLPSRAVPFDQFQHSLT